jgi:drug/metabolite transporter (DMT)-like permease
MLAGIAGILIIVVEPLLETGIGGSILGNIFLVIATLGAVIQTIIGKKMFHKFNPLSFTLWAFIIGAASFLPLAIYEYASIPHLYQLLNYRGYIGIIFGAFLSSALAYSLFAWGLSKISAVDVSLFTYIDPIAGTILAYFLLKEPITPPFIWGSILIFAGIFIAQGHLHYHPFLKLRSPKKPVVEVEIPAIAIDKRTALKRIFKH